VLFQRKHAATNLPCLNDVRSALHTWLMVKRAHMITRAYLEAWANSRGLLHVWDAENGINRPTSLTNATVVSFGYKTSISLVDVEAKYAQIESKAIPALRNLAQGGTITTDGQLAIVDFLDMHFERGSFADQSKVKTPVWRIGGPQRIEEVDMTVGDRLVLADELSRNLIRLYSLHIERWRWRVIDVREELVTGDGAVLPFRKTYNGPIITVTFPLSATKLLVIGEGLPSVPRHFNYLIVNRCRRWLVDQIDGAMVRTIGTH
jgi:hypothetical protein